MWRINDRSGAGIRYAWVCHHDSHIPRIAQPSIVSRPKHPSVQARRQSPTGPTGRHGRHERLVGPLAAGISALRRFYRPFVLIQVGAVLLVVAYHASASLRSACATLAALKVRGGLPFVALTTAVAGGVLPELAKLITDLRRNTIRGRGAEIWFNIAFFALNGVVIDMLYRGEARLFGTDGAFTTVAKKTAFDQFVFNPVWLPLIVVLYRWRSHGFSPAATVRDLRAGRFYRTHVVPLLLPAWCFWIPMVSIIYALPVPLQFLLFVPALGAWSLIMVFIAGGGASNDRDRA
jgi:hypothetical protein